MGSLILLIVRNLMIERNDSEIDACSGIGKNVVEKLIALAILRRLGWCGKRMGTRFASLFSKRDDESAQRRSLRPLLLLVPGVS